MKKPRRILPPLLHMKAETLNLAFLCMAEEESVVSAGAAGSMYL